MNLQGRAGLQMLEPVGEITCGRIDFLGHDLPDGLISDLKDIIKLVDLLKNGVDKGIADDRVAPDPHVVLLLLEGLHLLHDITGQLLKHGRVVRLVIDVLKPLLSLHLPDGLPVNFFGTLDDLHDISDAQ